MSKNIYEIYAETIEYTKHLEDLLKEFVGNDSIKEIRKQYIKPDTNVAEEWLKE